MIIPDGTRVTYHGSIEYAHGPGTVVDSHGPYYQLDESDTVRYVLHLDAGHNLHNVRPTSFTQEADSDD